MKVELVASKVATSVGPEDGHLVYAGGSLVAVLVRLTGDIAEATNAEWFLEAGFGDVTPVTNPTFSSLDEAIRWMEAHLRRTGSGSFLSDPLSSASHSTE